MSDLISSDTVAKELSVSPQTVQRWARQGKIPSVKLPGGRRRFDPVKVKYAMGFGVPPSGGGPQPNPFTHPQLNPPVEPSLTPPADGQVTVPSIQGLVALLQAGRKYYFQSDQAVRDSQQNAQIMERNLSIMEPLQSRMLSACQMPLTVQPSDQRDKKLQRYAQELQKIIEGIPNLFKYKWALMQAIWYGRAGVQNIYDWDFSEGYKRLIVKDWVPIHGDNLVYKFDSPAVGLRVGVASGNQGGGTKELFVEPADFSRVHPLTEHEREAHVIHTHLLLAGTYLDPYAGGNVKGTGIRNVIYWTWYLQNQCLAMLVEYLERAGLGMTIVTYQAGNPEDQIVAQQIAQAQSFNNVITLPRWPGQSKDGQNEIYRIEPSLAGVENFMKLINEYWNGEMRRYIVGQDSTSMKVESGLGSSIANVQESTFFRLVTMDCLNLEETLTRELLHVIMKYTFPELNPHQFKVKINTNNPNAKEYMEAVEKFITIGGSVIESEVRQTLGLTEPMPEDKVLGAKVSDDKVLGAEEEDGQMPAVEQEQEQPVEEENIQSLALNGAQISSLLEIVEQISTGAVPKETGKALIAVAFPTMPQERIDQIVDGLEVKEPEAEPESPMGGPKPPGGPPMPPGKPFQKYGWVTLKSGTHVMIGDDGKIEKGPASIAGKHVDDLKKKGKQQPKGGNVPQAPGGNKPQEPGGNKPQPSSPNGPQSPGGNKIQTPGGNKPQEPGKSPAPTKAPVAAPKAPEPTKPPVAAPNAEPKTPKPKAETKSVPKAEPTSIDSKYADKDEFKKALPGSKIKLSQIPDLTGMVGKGKVDISTDKDKIMRLDGSWTTERVFTVDAKVDGEDYTLHRKFYTDRGKKICKNEEFVVKPGARGNGRGLQVFSKQVEELSKAGINEIHTEAAGNATSEKYNGYKIWPKFGYDGPLNGEHKLDLVKAGGNFSKANTLQELLSMPGGEEAWAKHGSNINLSFDLKAGSTSRKVLEAYQARKAKGK